MYDALTHLFRPVDSERPRVRGLTVVSLELSWVGVQPSLSLDLLPTTRNLVYGICGRSLRGNLQNGANPSQVEATLLLYKFGQTQREVSIQLEPPEEGGKKFVWFPQPQVDRRQHWITLT